MALPDLFISFLTAATTSLAFCILKVAFESTVALLTPVPSRSADSRSEGNTKGVVETGKMAQKDVNSVNEVLPDR